VKKKEENLYLEGKKKFDKKKFSKRERK